VDALLADAQAAGTPIDGPGGLLALMTKAVLERALDVEIADHLGYEHGDPVGHGSGNSRNGHGHKTVLTTAGALELEVPRDRNGSFEPVIVPKRKRRLGQVEDMILSLYARGMSTRDITEHLGEVYGATVSATTISRVTDVVIEEIAAWQSRPVDPVYPILYIDAIRIKIRDSGVVANKAAHVVMGVDVEGSKQVLGIWIQQSEGAKFWHGVLTELRNRGCRDALFVCCDGLTGLPESITAVWPAAVIQTCVVHLLRSSMRYASYTDRRKMATALRPIYTAVTEEAATLALEAFRAPVENQIPRCSGRMGSRLGRVRTIPGIPGRDPQDHLHHQRHRVPELPATQSHQSPRLVRCRSRRGVRGPTAQPWPLCWTQLELRAHFGESKRRLARPVDPQ